MKNRSKRYREALNKIDQNKLYPLAEAIQLVKETGKTKFDASIEVHIKLGVDSEKADQGIRGTILFPQGLGKTRKIIAFVSPEKEKVAKEAGADIIGDDATIQNIKETKKCDFDLAIAESQVMKKLSGIAKILGQKGLMPNPKSDTITTDIKKAIQDFKQRKSIFRSDDSGNIHQMIGKLSFDNKKLEENYTTLLDAVKKAKPESVKGIYLRSIYLTSSMGPSIKVAL